MVIYYTEGFIEGALL